MVTAWDSYGVARDLQADHAVEVGPDPQCLAQHVDVRLLAVPGQVLVQPAGPGRARGQYHAMRSSGHVRGGTPRATTG